MTKEDINNQKTDFSYYELYLSNYMIENHPEKFEMDFIKGRADQAANVFEQSRLEGHTPEGAHELAMSALMNGLHFSKINTICDVLEKEYSELFQPNLIRTLARKFLPFLEETFAKYTLSDEFNDSSEYDLLYTEITGAIQIHIEDHGI